MRKLLSFLAVAGSASLIAISASASDLDEVGSALIETYKSSFNSGDAASLADLYAEDAVILAPNAGRVEGRDAIAALMAIQIDQMGARDIEIEGQETTELGDALYQSGLYRMTMSGPDGDVPVAGGWLSILEETETGDWVIKRHVWNVDLPTP